MSGMTQSACGGDGGNRTRVRTTFLRTELQLFFHRNSVPTTTTYAPIFGEETLHHCVRRVREFSLWIHNTKDNMADALVECFSVPVSLHKQCRL